MMVWVWSFFAMVLCCLLNFELVPFAVIAQNPALSPLPAKPPVVTLATAPMAPSTTKKPPTDTEKKGGGGGHGGGGGSHGSGGSRGGGANKGAGSRGAGARGGGPGRAVGPAPHVEPPGFPKAMVVLYGARLVAPRPIVRGGEPNDTTLGEPFKYGGIYGIHNHNPCEWFNEGSKSHKNKQRSHGCDKECNHLKKAVKKLPSSNCPHPGHCKCFQISGMAGRCYTVGNTDDPPENWQYVLIETCQPA